MLALAAALVVTGVTPGEAYVAWTGGAGAPEVSPAATVERLADRAGALGEVHHARLSTLKAGTAYEVSAGGERARFSTPPSSSAGPPARLRFLVYGDDRTNTSDHAKVVQAILAREPDLAFAIQTGDMAQNYPFTQQWPQFFAVERELLERVPVFAVLGNHETIDLGGEYARWFSPPDFDPAKLVRFSSMDWGQVHVALVDTFDTTRTDSALNLGLAGGVSDAQVEWLKADLAAAKARGQLLFAAMHQGPWSHPAEHVGHGGSVEVQRKVVPVLTEDGVLATFAGHDHYYERGRLEGLDYFVVGGGGAPLYDVNAAAPGVLAAKKTLSYVVIEVLGRKVTGYARDADGTVIDRFELAR